ncbi:MAG TPA: serine hydrolase domain-containing protein [Candidatus Baltobacteraceae bacterium]|nr:serine hydrolase domain-containing protein [Candidatus Baltobacteraceae bacterium]
MIGLVLCAALAAPAHAATIAPPRHAAAALRAADLQPFFDGLVPYAIRRADIAGAGVVVVQDGKIVFTKGYGYADVAKRTPVIPDRTLFRPGSVSKLFTWTAVMQLVQAGKINLDADVNTYLDFKIPPKYGKPITVRNLMTHTGGFEEVIRDLFVDKPSRLYPLDAYLKEHVPDRIFPPGTVIAYSNYGAALAGYIVQRVSGQPFDRYVAEHIFKPLGMTHSTFEQPLPANLVPLMADGYTAASAQKPTPFELVEAAPAGAATASVTDMAHFMIAYLNGGSYDGRSMLKPATIAQMFTLQVAPAPGMNGYDLGFYQENRNGRTIVGHGGDTGVFHSDLHLLPKAHVGIFMSFNSAGKNGAVEDVRTQIFRAFLDRYFPYTPSTEHDVAHPERDAARVAGWYQSSRREERALRFVYALDQVGVSARDDGTLEVSMLTDPAGNPLRWREVGPLYYREVGGQAHLKFNADASGRVVSWTSDDFIPVFIFQRVDGLTSLGALKPMLLCFVAILIISLLIRLGGWIARRRLGLRLELTSAEKWIHLAARLGAILFLATLAGWVVLLSDQNALLQSSFVTKIVVLYVAGVLAIIGGIAMIAETGLRVAHGPGGWFVRTGEVIVALAALYGIWFFLAFGLTNFVTNF